MWQLLSAFPSLHFIWYFSSIFFVLKICFLHNKVIHATLWGQEKLFVYANVFLVDWLQILLHGKMPQTINTMHDNENSEHVSEFSEGECFIKDPTSVQHEKLKWHIASWCDEKSIFYHEALFNLLNLIVFDSSAHYSLDISRILPSFMLLEELNLLPKIINRLNPKFLLFRLLFVGLLIVHF